MKVIDILNKMANGEELPKSIKYNDKIYNLYIDDNFINYEPECGDWLFNQYLYKLNDEIEIIEESKEELEEIELLDNRKAYEVIDLIDGITTKHKWEYCDVIQNTKINELIENQNKIIRELKDNKENE